MKEGKKEGKKEGRKEGREEGKKCFLTPSQKPVAELKAAR